MNKITTYKNRIALVTGAADGIGAMLARGFAGLGMQVGIVDIREEQAQCLAQEIGNDTFALQCDVSDRDQLVALANGLRDTNRIPAIVWINAGVGLAASIIEASERAILWGYGVNVLGAIWTAQTLVPLLLEGERPAHVGITASSASLQTPAAPLTLYGATKQATFAVGEALMSELVPQGVDVTLLCPGLLNTNIWDAARARPDNFGGPRSMDPAISGPWREAKSPDLMWPHIQQRLECGGGYLVCATDENTLSAFQTRAELIASGFAQL